MNIRCLAIDDEPFALKQIAGYIRETPFLELIGECYNAYEAMEILATRTIDLMFVDVEMPGISGMEFVKALSPTIPVIFTTAYSQYAVESYKVDAVDYLLKPVTYQDFLRAARKAQKLFLRNPEKLEKKAPRDHVFVHSEGKIIRISYAEIDYIESMSEYIRICLSSRRQVMTLMRLKTLEEILPADQFMRVHRSYIVNKRNITTIERDRIIYYGSTYIPVSELYRPEFRRFIDANFLQGG